MQADKTIGLLPFARSTFDVAYAEEKLTAMLTLLDAGGYTLKGSRELLFDSDSSEAAMAELATQEIDLLLVLQVTFTDAAMVCQVASRFRQPLAIWAVPEPRLGGRLRLNAFCGLNLASHALGLQRREFGWLYQDADPGCVAELSALLDGRRNTTPLTALDSAQYASAQGRQIANSLQGKKIACIGDHPEGFATCAYQSEAVNQLTGMQVNKIALETLFDKAREADKSATAELAAQLRQTLVGVEKLNSEELDRSLRLKLALDSIRQDGRFDAFAIRCWPETFTEYGGAVCGPVSMLGEAKLPCACEADVYGAMTQLLLQQVAGDSVFLVDLVDIDSHDDTAVVWHCGQAPVSMADPDMPPGATIHSNRKMPLLYEFALKPGQVSFARLSQSAAETRLVVARGEMLKRPSAYTGTSGVVRFEGGASMVLDNLLNSSMEHHIALAYGDHLQNLRSVAAALDIPLIELSA